MTIFARTIRRSFLAAMCLALISRSAVAGPSVASGTYHTVLLTDTGVVWVWGVNNWGQFGNGTTTDSKVPVVVLSISGMTAVAAGGNSSYALKNDGTVWAWGENTNGQLGDNTQTWRTSPVQVSGLTNVVAIAAGNAHALAL